ncbi:tetratricopeptide repeat protein [Trichocoleus sp. FACHB-262]|uniref:tetratricopeptide repeat protein n=1 Tax=Trichocoleus sp. FACHB-262 TaxID=2692869 RepID=UPI001688DAAC|nr:tetratricopeptide repeat protein [Trichocoleus sp. FACHB-262]MBD2120537.1 tetratricopeptide repeat protein [Trichocoleus sp. FACHB-262]
MIPNRSRLTPKLLPLVLLGTTLLPQPGFARDRLQDLKDPAYWSQLCTLLGSKPTDTLPACERALELRPKEAPLWTRYGSLLLGSQQYSEAIAAFGQALKRQPKNSQAWAGQCLAWKELGDDEAAVTACDQALKINTNWGDRSALEAQHTRSLIRNQELDYQTALQFYQQVLEQQPTYSLALFYRGEALEKLGKSQEAIDAYQRALKGDDNWGTMELAQTWYLRGLTHRRVKEAELAVKAFDRALSFNPNDGPTWFQLADTLRELQRPTEALSAYNRVLEIQPTSSQALLGQCLTLNQLQQAEAALAACQKTLQGNAPLSPEEVAQVWNQQSYALTNLGKLEDALTAANRVVGMRPDWSQGWSDRAVVLWHLKQYETALASVEKAISLDPQDARAWANQGRIWRSLNNPEKALAAYTEALKIDPENASVWANLSAVQWSQGDHGAALDAANRAVTVDPKLLQGWQNRATALVALQKYPDAQTSYERAIEIDQNSADSWAGLGLVLAKQRQYPQAIAALQTAVSLNPQQSLAQQALEALMEVEPPVLPK